MTVYRANPFDRLSPGLKWLLGANAAMFMLQMVFPEPILNYLSLQPMLVLKKFYFWQLVTYSFLHGNFWHLFINMFALWMFGPHIEYYWGTKTLLRYYFL